MSEKLENALAALAAEALRPGEHVLAAVSGGADSVALLRLLCLLRDQGRIRLSAAHFEHGIRAEASLADMRFVQELCKELNVPLFTGRGDVPAESRNRRAGIEQTARDMRRAFLLQAKEQACADAIALAHHADDQAETVLMHLLRGSGGKGACGMRLRDGVWLRPLLHCRKAELIDYLAGAGFDWREDATNFETFTPRNALRLNVVPQMEKVYPGAVQAMARFARIQQRESDFLQEEAEKWLGENARVLPGGARVSLRNMPHEAVLARAMKLLAGQEAAYTDIDRLCRLCQSGGMLDLRGEYRLAQAASGEIWFLKELPPRQKIPIVQKGETNLPPWGTLRTKDGTGVPVKDDPLRQELDALALSGARLRLWQKGDRIRPLGMGGKSRLLSDVYSDRGIPPQRRQFMPVLERDGEILWAVGACISETAKLHKNSRALSLEWIPAQERPWKNTQDDGGKRNAE